MLIIPKERAARLSAYTVKAAVTYKAKKEAAAPKKPAVKGSYITKPVVKGLVNKSFIKRIKRAAKSIVILNKGRSSDAPQDERVSKIINNKELE